MKIIKKKAITVKAVRNKSFFTNGVKPIFSYEKYLLNYLSTDFFVLKSNFKKFRW
jgi:hypothetical protein